MLGLPSSPDLIWLKFNSIYSFKTQLTLHHPADGQQVIVVDPGPVGQQLGSLPHPLLLLLRFPLGGRGRVLVLLQPEGSHPVGLLRWARATRQDPAVPEPRQNLNSILHFINSFSMFKGWSKQTKRQTFSPLLRLGKLCCKF